MSLWWLLACWSLSNRRGHVRRRSRSRSSRSRRSRLWCRQTTTTPNAPSGRLRLRHQYRHPLEPIRCRSMRRHEHAQRRSRSRRFLRRRSRLWCHQTTTTPRPPSSRLWLRHQYRHPSEPIRCRSIRRHEHAQRCSRFRRFRRRRSRGWCRQLTTTPRTPSCRLRLRRQYRHPTDRSTSTRTRRAPRQRWSRQSARPRRRSSSFRIALTPNSRALAFGKSRPHLMNQRDHEGKISRVWPDTSRLKHWMPNPNAACHPLVTARRFGSSSTWICCSSTRSGRRRARGTTCWESSPTSWSMPVGERLQI